MFNVCVTCPRSTGGSDGDEFACNSENQGSTPGSGRSPGEGVIAMLSGKQTHSEGQYRWWSAVYYTGRPKAVFPLSQGPRPAFVKIFYTPCVHVQTHHPNPLMLTKDG